MTTLLVTVLATSLALALCGGVATAADAPPQTAPSEGKLMWESCAQVGESDRDQCMAKVAVKDSAAGRQCEDLMGRAQRRCVLEFLEGKRTLPRAE